MTDHTVAEHPDKIKIFDPKIQQLIFKRKLSIKKKKLNNRQRMRESNRIARETLLKEGYDQIWFKMHTRRHDRIYTQNGAYSALDLWNLFDGACFDIHGRVVFFQVKTNAWPKASDIVEFTKDKIGFDVLLLNVVKKGERWQVKKREIKA